MKTFVYAAVAATIAASSAMASGSFGTPGETHWKGDVNGLPDSCEFRDNVNGVMGFDNTKTWTTTTPATLTVVQRGATGVLVQPEQFVYETDISGSIVDNDDGIAHAVNVDYRGETDSAVTIISQDDSEPGQLGNTDEDELKANKISFHKGDKTGSSLILDNTDLDASGRVAEMLIAEQSTTIPSGLAGKIADGKLPRIMDLKIRGTATLVDEDDLILVDNKSYALQHNVTCLQ